MIFFKATILCTVLFSLQIIAKTQLSAKGIYYFTSREKCPLAEIGTRGKNDCHRIFLDDNQSKLAV
jgi:hypothetical protein